MDKVRPWCMWPTVESRTAKELDGNICHFNHLLPFIKLKLFNRTYRFVDRAAHILTAFSGIGVIFDCRSHVSNLGSIGR